MRLSDIMSAMELSRYAEVALVLFMIVFIAVVLRVLSRRNAERWEAARYMPLEDARPLEERTELAQEGNDR